MRATSGHPLRFLGSCDHPAGPHDLGPIGPENPHGFSVKISRTSSVR